MEYNTTNFERTAAGYHIVKIPAGFRIDPSTLMPDGKFSTITEESYNEKYGNTILPLSAAVLDRTNANCKQPK